jgi:rubredoxin
VKNLSIIEYACNSCGWVYRASEQNGTEFGDLPSEWTCPECQGDQDNFTINVPGGLEGEDTESNDDNPPNHDDEDVSTLPIGQRVVYTQKLEASIFELHRQWKIGDLNVQPYFQRNYVWSAKQASRLVESVFLNVPIPLIYVAEEPIGTFAVIDGQQRLTSLFRYMDNLYAISGLEHRKDLNGVRYEDLGREMKRHLENYTLSVVQIRKESHPDIRFEVFERLNLGAAKLNDQELRNCVYRGDFNEFLKRQAKFRQFLELFGLQEPDPRMSDVELVLRFTAFWDQTYLNFRKKRLNKFLNEQMARGQASFTQQRYQELERTFRNAVSLSRTVFGDKAFKRFSIGTRKDPQGKWENQPNKALYDIVMWGFSRYTQSQIVPVSDAIFEELVNLMTTDRQFEDAITYATADPNKVKLRFTRWQNALDSIVGFSGPEPRTFTIDKKKQLFAGNPTCALCNQQIRLLADAHVHHIQHYWRGGSTVPENAALVHRYCNLAEGGGN